MDADYVKGQELDRHLPETRPFRRALKPALLSVDSIEPVD